MNLIIIFNCQGSVEEANERLIFYSHYNDTLDKDQQDKEKQLARLHPLNYIKDNCLNYNSMFDELDKDNAVSTPKKTVTEVSH